MNEKEKQILTWMYEMKKAPISDLATICEAQGLYPLQSAKTIVARILKDEVVMGRLKEEKIGGRSVFMLPNLTGFGEHDELKNKAIVQVLSKFSNVKVEREHLVDEVKLRPDLICYVDNGMLGCILVVEAICSESEQYFSMKRTVWQWDGACAYLSRLFGVEVPYFHLCSIGKKMGDTLLLEEALELMTQEVEHGLC